MDKRDPMAAARGALADGRPWEARDRLTGLLGSRPGDLEAMALLGDAWSQMKDPARAARYWLLADRDGPEVDHAMAAWREAEPSPVRRARAVRWLAVPDQPYSSAAQARLAELQGEVEAAGGTWQPGGQPQGPPPAWEQHPVRDAIGFALVILLAVVPWMVGCATVVVLVAELLS